MAYSVKATAAPRVTRTYWCARGHETEPSFALEANVPDLWDCPRCGLPAGQDAGNPPSPPRTEPYKTHLAYVKERRSETEAATLLDDALRELREGRGEE